MRLSESRLVLLAAVALAIATLQPAAREFWAVDACLDSGRVYDYAQRRCRGDVERLPAAPGPGPWLRVPDRTSLGTAAGVTFLLALWLAARDRNARPSSRAA